MQAAIKRALRRAVRAAARTAPGSRIVRILDEDREPLIVEVPQPVPETDPTDELRREYWDRYVGELPSPTFADLTEELSGDSLPPLDRAHVHGDLTEEQRHWREHGYVIKKGLIPDDVLDAYYDVRSRLDRPHGWDSHAPYLHVPEIRDLGLHPPLMDLLQQLIGEPLAMTLNLTGWRSTERNWHQDDYLNPPGVKGWYAAAWFALRDIDPDSGPFQFVPGSHRWPVLRHDRVRLFLTPEERDRPDWPRLTERFLNDVLDKEIAHRGAEVKSFVGGQGDVLIWHARLVHRGSTPGVFDRPRVGFISHYTGVNHWEADHEIATHPGGGRYVIQDIPLS